MRTLRFIINLGKCTVKDDFFGMASEMAFSFVLAFFPFLIFLVSIFGAFGTEDHVDKIITYMQAFMPSNVMLTIRNTLHDIVSSSTGGLLTFGFLFTAIIASNGVFVITKGLNRAYNIEETRSFLHVRLLSLIMLFINALVVFIGVNLIIFGKTILGIVLNFVHIPLDYVNTVLLVRWPIVFMALFTMVFINYYFMPNIQGHTRAKFFSVFPGSLFFCIFWLLASWIFSIYVDNFAMFNKVYGTIGVFAALLLWLYYTSLVILVGGEINSQFYKKLENKKSCLFDDI